MNNTRWSFIAASFIIAACWVGACSSDETGPGSSSGQGGAAAHGGGAHGGSGTGGTLFGGGGPQGCTTSADCDGGVCVNSICCDSAAAACGKSCCQSSETCLFDKCVTPGAPCITEADCAPDEYCEPALGEGGSGGGGTAGGCTAPLPASGRCLPRPPICGPNPDPNEECIEPCEYHPPGGQLDAVRKWQWGYDPAPTEYPNQADVWSTPAVARIYDANCDGDVNLADPPQIVFVSTNSQSTCCHCGACGGSPSCCQTGVLRMLDGASGQEIWSLDKAKPGAFGFAGVSVALGDIDGDKHADVVAVTGDGYIALLDAGGNVLGLSDQPVAKDSSGAGFGWGGGLSLGDMDGDGHPEIAYGRTLFTTNGSTITRLWVGTGSWGKWSGQGGVGTAISHFVDLDNNGDLELLAGGTAYRLDGTMLWNKSIEGFTAVGDFDKDGAPEVVLISNDTVRLLEGATGNTFLGWSPLGLPGTGHGGPPTVADFDGDGYPEIGVAQQNRYSVIKPNLGNNQLELLWAQVNHDMSSAVTGSSVFDFDGDGKAEVVYNDECYLWVYDGTNGDVLFISYTQSFTATESSIVADVDGDGHAEMLILANGADPNVWTCAHHDAPGKIVAPHTEAFPVWLPPQGAANYRGITVLGDAANSWVGTRTLWNQHAYQVTNVCDPRDSACDPGAYYGQVPTAQKKNWMQPWLNNFRQNVQDKGLFDAPDAVVDLEVECVDPVAMKISVRNMGLSGLPAGIDVAVVKLGTPEVQLGIVSTTMPLMPGQTEVIDFVAPGGQATVSDTFQARILLDPNNATFHECREDNNESAPVTPSCVQ